MRTINAAGKGSVLVVEDSPEIQRYVQFMLQLDGYQVATANNGEEAMRHLRKGNAPSVVLLDVQMPGIDGIETLRLLRALRPELKVIMCSGVENPETVRQAMSLGAQGYLVKPVRHLYLSAAIEQCLGVQTVKNGGSGAPRRVIEYRKGESRPN